MFRTAMIVLSLAISGLPLVAQTISFSRHFTTPGMNQATAVASDASGVYVFGVGRGAGGSAGSSGVRKFDSSGNELWTRDFTSPAGQFFRATADLSGVYVIGFIGAASQTALRKYSSGGDELWTRQLEDIGIDLAADGTGVYVTGGNFLRKYSPDGVELWTNLLGDIQTGTGIAVDATGVYLQLAYSNGTPGMVVRKYDSGGNELWTRVMNLSDVHRTFTAADPAGFYAIAADSSGSGTWFSKYDSDGNELWSLPGIPDNPGIQITVDTTGVYVAGQVPATYPPYRPYTALPGHCQSGSGGDSFVRKYSPDGAEMWTREFGTTDAAWVAGVAADNSGVYVVGEEGTAQVQEDTEHVDAFAPANPTRNAFLVKLESSTAAVTSSGPRIFADCVVNAASYLGGGVTPGEMVTIFGSAIGPAVQVPMPVTGGRLATTLADTRVLFNGIPAPLLYVSDQQSSAIVPYELAGQASVDVQVEFMGSRSAPVTVPVLPSRPGLFTVDGSGWGQALILNEDGSLNSPSNPARRGSVITLYGTGGGEAAPDVKDGVILGNALPFTGLPVWVFFDLTDNEFQVPSKAGEVLYSGGVSGSVAGLLQIKLRVPANTVSKGDAVPFLLIIGSHWTVYQVTVALQ